MSANRTDDANHRARMKILMLVRVVHQNNSARRLSVPMAPCSCNTPSEVPLLQSERSGQITALKELILGVSREIGSLKGTVVELKRELEARDSLLIALESGVTSLVEKSTSLDAVVRGWVAREVVAREAVAVNEEEPVAEGERDCVEAMMCVTTILHADDRKKSCVRGIYKRLQSESPLTAAILRFIVKQSGVSVHIDCSSDTIERMKGRLVDHNREEKGGRIFVDYSEMRAYVAGGKIGGSEWEEKGVAARLVCALFQLALNIAFNNEGRPYAERDTPNRRHFKEVLRQAEIEMKWKRHIDFFTHPAIVMEEEKAREINFVTLITSKIVQFGLNSREIAEHRRRLPLLFEYVEGHVMAALESTDESS
ncbi:uncharacterized protein [Hetaerina americana]